MRWKELLTRLKVKLTGVAGASGPLIVTLARVPFSFTGYRKRTMELGLDRTRTTRRSMTGKLSIDGVYECVTIERSPEDPDYKPIPEGRYQVVIRHSNHFGRDIPHIENVPGRTGIEIHIANRASELHGCVGVAEEEGIDEIYKSKIAFDALFNKLAACKEPMFITVKNSENEDRREL